MIRGPDAVVEVYGTGFSFLSFPRGSVFFGATLEDGSLLGVALNLEDGAAPPVLHEVPEPSGAWLSLAALGALAALRRRRSEVPSQLPAR